MVLARITSVELAENPRVRYRGLSANSTLWVMSGTALTFVPANQRWTPIMSERSQWAPSCRSCTPRLTVDDEEDQSDEDSEDHDLRRSKRAR